MKNRLTKIVSSLLILAFLASFTSVFVSAADIGAGSASSETTTIFNRGFDDGWEPTNGGFYTPGNKVHSIGLGKEPSATGINYYLEMITAGTGAAIYYQIAPTGEAHSSATEFVLQWKVRSDGYSTKGNVTLLVGQFGETRIVFLSKKDDGLYFGNEKICEDYSAWVDLTASIVIDYRKSTVTVQVSSTSESFESQPLVVSATGNNLAPSWFRFQAMHSTTSNKVGDHLAIDDICYVAGTSTPVKVADDDYGILVDTTARKTVPVGDAVLGDDRTTSERIEDALLMKTGVHRALLKGERVNIFSGDYAGEYGGPVLIDGITYLPLLPILDFMGYNYTVSGTSSVDIPIATKDPITGAVTTGVISIYIGRNEASLLGETVKLTAAPGIVKTGLYTTNDDGEEVEISYVVIPMNDIEKLFTGWYITYDVVGFIMLGSAPDLMNRETDLTAMATLLKEFVPDYPDTETLLNEFTEATDNFERPYLVGEEEDLLFLRAVYNKEYLLADGTPNQEFIDEWGLTLEELEVLYSIAYDYVDLAFKTYLNFLVDRDHPVLTNGSGDIINNPVDYMYDANGNFIYPYTQDMKGSQDDPKMVFARPFTSKGFSGKQYDYVHDDYVIAESHRRFQAKKDYIYDDETGQYVYVGYNKGVFDYVYDDYVILKTPLRNYVRDEATGEYRLAEAGETGVYDLVGIDAAGNNMYAELRTPLKNYAFVDENKYDYGWYFDTQTLIYPGNIYATFDLDPRNSTYLDEISSVCSIPSCNADHFGYDCSGARHNSEGMAIYALNLGIAYWLTGEKSFARLAYDILDIMGNWEHWGPGHALNYAEASGKYSLTIDLIYNVVNEMAADGETNYKGEAMDIKVLQQHLWDHGIGEDYIMSVRLEYSIYGRDASDVPGYVRTRTTPYWDDYNNWGNVCNCNLAIAAIGLLDFDGVLTSDMRYAKDYPQVSVGVPFLERVLESLENKMWCLAVYAADSYLENGAYKESPSYWAYGTNEMMLMQMVLYNTVGHDYGLLDCPGYDNTFRYAANIETQMRDDYYLNFAYNDGDPAAMQTGFFFIASIMLNQPELAAIRYEQIKAGKFVTYSDLFNFREAVIASRSVEYELEIDYCEELLDLFITRSDWEVGALFTGLMGGVGVAGHGHSDAGEWIYYNKGVEWIADMGSENYNVMSDTDYPANTVAGDWDSATGKLKLHNRFRYYRLSTEGHNTLFLTGHPDTLPYGHTLSYFNYAHFMELGENGQKFYSDEHGSYAILDMSEMFYGGDGTQYTTSAKRGLLLTNDRSTVVIQDELSFKNMEFIAWCAHVNMTSEVNIGKVKNIVISDDRKQVYLYSWGGDTVCRLSIVMEYEDSRFGFEIRKTDPVKSEMKDHYLLDSTFAYDAHLEIGGGKQNSRSDWKNLVITPNRNGVATTVRDLKMAVVVEVFENEDIARSAPVSYEYTPMSQWATYAEGTYGGVDDNAVELRKKATTEDFDNIIIPYGTMLDFSLRSGLEIYEIPDVYTILTDGAYTIRQLGGANTFTEYNRQNAEYINRAVAIYESYAASMNARLKDAANIVDRLT